MERVGTRDIEGEVTRVGASERGSERVSKPSGHESQKIRAAIRALDNLCSIQRVDENVNPPVCAVLDCLNDQLLARDRGAASEIV